MERHNNNFSPELLRMMRDEERQKFLAALKDGASWVQLYQIRNTIRKLNDMIEAANETAGDPLDKESRRGDEGNPRTSGDRS